MIDTAVVVLTVCFAIGIFSSALFVASFYLYRESRWRDVEKINKSAICTPKNASTNPNSQTELETGNLDTANCASGFRGEHGVEAETRGSNSETSSSCSYTCEVCGSCGAGDRQRLDELQPGQRDFCLQTCQQTPLGYPCGDFFVSSVDVGFKCQVGTDSGGEKQHGGTFFFFRSRQQSKLLERVEPSKHYLTMAAIPSVPYHLWFCLGQGHSAKSQRCPECWQLLSFEIGDKEIQFHPSEKTGCVWLLAYEETSSGSSHVIYRGNAGALTRLQYFGKLFVCFALPTGGLLPGWFPRAGPVKHPTISAVTAEDTSVLDKGTDKSLPAPTASGPPGLLHQQQFPRRNFNSGINVTSLDLSTNVDYVNDDSDASYNKNKDAGLIKRESDQEPTPQSIGSMRNAARWPITQFENVIESSNSEDPVISINSGMRRPSSPSPMPPQKESNIDASMTSESERFPI